VLAGSTSTRALLAVEAVIRIALCLAAWLFRDQAPWLLSLAMGLRC
jgi:hypothetical protein